MSDHGPSWTAGRGGNPGVDLESGEAVRVEIDAVAVRLTRLSEAGAVPSRPRETVQRIGQQLEEVRQRLAQHPSRVNSVLDALSDAAEHVYDLARTYQDCVYGPALVELADRITVIVNTLIAHP